MLSNPVQLEARSTRMERKSTSSSLKPRFWAPPAVLLILLTTGLCCMPVRGTTTTNTIEFANLLPQPGSVRWEDERELNEQRQETYRKRLSIQDSASPFVPRAITANLINGPQTPPVHPPSGAGAIERFFDLCFFAAILLLSGGLLARRFAPELITDFNHRFNPWAIPPVGARNYPACLRSEEEPFGEFLATFRAGPATSPRADEQATEIPHAEFYAQAKKRLANQRRLFQEISRQANDLVRKKRLLDLYFELGGLKDDAGFPEVLPVWQVASAMEGLLKELGGKIKNVTPSTLRTILGGLDLLDKLCVPGATTDLLTNRPFKFLVVDDDLISRQALTLSLKKAFSQPDQATDGFAALIHTARQVYDVIFLDVQMPEMDGFELCQLIHNSDLNRTTPVVFVTSHSDFDARAKSTLTGGNDLMGKPFLIFEVTVKALTLALQGRLLTKDSKPAPQIQLAAAASNSQPAMMGKPRSVATPAIQRRSQPAKASAESKDSARAFLNRAAEQLGPLRELCETLLQADDVARRQNLLADGFLRINSLLAKNDSEVIHPAYQLCCALEGLFRKLLQDSGYSTPSTLVTIAAAMDLLNELCLPGLKADLGVNPPIRLLVVDDDLVARRALTGALQITFKKPESVESGEAALSLALEEQFDVVFLDLQMPGMNGFETCSKIRETRLNQSTPVVFVTAHCDSIDPAETDRSGGNDLVGKPFLTSEINLKALTYALRSRLQPSKLEACL
jgi:CheY-like chemotaxis protein